MGMTIKQKKKFQRLNRVAEDIMNGSTLEKESFSTWIEFYRYKLKVKKIK